MEVSRRLFRFLLEMFSFLTVGLFQETQHLGFRNAQQTQRLQQSSIYRSWSLHVELGESLIFVHAAKAVAVVVVVV